MQVGRVALEQGCPLFGRQVVAGQRLIGLLVQLGQKGEVGGRPLHHPRQISQRHSPPPLETGCLAIAVTRALPPAAQLVLTPLVTRESTPSRCRSAGSPSSRAARSAADSS